MRRASPSHHLLFVSLTMLSDYRFDETEVLIRAGHDSRTAQYPVHVFGDLTIDSLNWLSDQGKDLLQKELRRRDKEQHLAMNFVSGLTLETLYGNSRDEGSRITVRVKIDKNMNAEFLTCIYLSIILLFLNAKISIYSTETSRGTCDPL